MKRKSPTCMPSKSLNINKFIQVKDPFKLFVVFCLRHAHMESQWRHKNLHEQYEEDKKASAYDGTTTEKSIFHYFEPLFFL